MYDVAKWGQIPDELWVDCVVASNVDPTFAPEGTHVMTCFVQYVPYELRDGTWDQQRDAAGGAGPGEGGPVRAQRSGRGPGQAGGDAARPGADLRPDRGQHLPRRPQHRATLLSCVRFRVVRSYRTPVNGLYLCGAGVHPGGGVTGAPGLQRGPSGASRSEAEGPERVRSTALDRRRDRRRGCDGRFDRLSPRRAEVGPIPVVDKGTSPERAAVARRRWCGCTTAFLPRCDLAVK